MSGRALRAAPRAVLALVVLLALTAPLLLDLTRVQDPRDRGMVDPDDWWSFNLPMRPGDSFDEMIRRLSVRPNWYTFYTGLAAGLAAREAAGGPIGSVSVPEDVTVLQSVGPLGEVQPMHAGYLYSMTGGNLRYVDYDAVLDPRLIALFEEQGRTVAFTWGAVAVVGDSASPDVYLYRDEAGEHIYALPADLAPDGEVE